MADFLLEYLAAFLRVVHSREVSDAVSVQHVFVGDEGGRWNRTRTVVSASVHFAVVRKDGGDILCPEERELAFELCRKPQVIAVEERDVASVRRTDSDVARCGGHPRRPFVAKKFYAWISLAEFFYDAHRIVRRRVIDDEQLPVRERLALHGADCIGNIFFAVVTRHDDGNLGHGGSPLFFEKISWHKSNIPMLWHSLFEWRKHHIIAVKLRQIFVVLLRNGK